MTWVAVVRRCVASVAAMPRSVLNRWRPLVVIVGVASSATVTFSQTLILLPDGRWVDLMSDNDVTPLVKGRWARNGTDTLIFTVADGYSTMTLSTQDGRVYVGHGANNDGEVWTWRGERMTDYGSKGLGYGGRWLTP